MTRRGLLHAGGAVVVGMALRPIRVVAAAEDAERHLVAAAGKAPIRGAAQPATDLWCYNGAVPGPEIRVRQGDRVRIVVENRLTEDTTIHWHGLRVPNAMDGAAFVTQPPIQSGGSFTYEYTVPDAGTYWYHPHLHSAEQVGRGLAGPFIVEEREPLPVDRDVVWVLGDFRLKPDGSIAGGFNNPMETAMSGRIGNTVTINGRVPEAFSVASGERIRLRLINAAPSRIFRLEFRGHRPIVIANDGQPIEPHRPDSDRIVLGPAMRIDLIIDMLGQPGSTAPILDSFYEGLPFKLVDIAYSGGSSVKSAQPPPTKLPANPIPEPDLAASTRHEVALTGGMGMGGMGMGMMGGGNGMMGGMGGMMAGMMGGPMWMMNGVAMPEAKMGHMDPILTLARGKSYVIAIDNQTAWFHPIHLHGHSFRVLSRNGEAPKYAEWRDTILMPPREKAEVAFVADNPGDWMFHCHILDHQEGGMMSVIRVA